MSKYYGRCLTRTNGRKCTGRRMLTKKPADYIRPPQCPHCGARRWYLDTNIVRRHKRERCNCGGLHFTHRIKSKGCYHSPTVEQDTAAKYELSYSGLYEQ